MINFTWWVNRKDLGGRNIFQGGFLGLDNIGVFDRSAPLPTGGYINQADGTSWMAMYCLNLMRISLELAKHNSIYEDIASKFFEHFLYIAQAMTNMAEEGIGLWDEKDEFFYDVLQLPEGRSEVLRLRSMVGLIPLFAVETLEPESARSAAKLSPKNEMGPRQSSGSGNAGFSLGCPRKRAKKTALPSSGTSHEANPVPHA
jgi:hypothetical protein